MNELLHELNKETQERLGGTEISRQAQIFYENNRAAGAYMFGYPAHRYPLSPLTQYLLLMHYTSPFSNNCGDIDERGNYAMDTKTIEKKIVGLYAEKFGMGENFWGYVTSGGSESNSCGITLAFSKNPNGILYYFENAHYSVEKYASTYPCTRIPSFSRDIPDYGALFEAIEKNYKEKGAAANIVLTHGTTRYGACDGVDKVVAFLREKKIPYYLHVDAALFGGIQNGQKDAPILSDCKQRGIDSVSVSLHKYVGFPDVKSVFVATEKPRGKEIAYIGQHDTTVSGSRSIPAYALYNHLREQLRETDTEQYSRAVKRFEKLLTEAGVPFYRAPLSNIFVIDEPSPCVCKKYQLSCFEDGGKALAHIIVFPSHGEKEMQELVNDLKE
ncbi:MAG: hypothetical protein IJB34_02350 [Clostridia bacterium]|nr:hypothetical protein [Clostridia bacterium]